MTPILGIPMQKCSVLPCPPYGRAPRFLLPQVSNTVANTRLTETAFPLGRQVLLLCAAAGLPAHGREPEAASPSLAERRFRRIATGHA